MILADEAIALAIPAVAGDEEGMAMISETTSYFRGVTEGVIYGCCTDCPERPADCVCGGRGTEGFS